MIAHSIVQGGPTFCCLCPAVYSYMVYGSKERALEELPSAEDIPRNAATSGICSLIEEGNYCNVHPFASPILAYLVTI